MTAKRPPRARKRCAHIYCKKFFVGRNHTQKYCRHFCMLDQYNMSRGYKPYPENRANWYQRRAASVRRLKKSLKLKRVGYGLVDGPIYTIRHFQNASPEHFARMYTKLQSVEANYSSTLHEKTKARV